MRNIFLVAAATIFVGAGYLKAADYWRCTLCPAGMWSKPGAADISECYYDGSACPKNRPLTLDEATACLGITLPVEWGQPIWSPANMTEKTTLGPGIYRFDGRDAYIGGIAPGSQVMVLDRQVGVMAQYETALVDVKNSSYASMDFCVGGFGPWCPNPATGTPGCSDIFTNPIDSVQWIKCIITPGVVDSDIVVPDNAIHVYKLDHN